MAAWFHADAFNDGQVAVFLPGAPDPSSGVVQIVSANHITPLNISYLDALACLWARSSKSKIEWKGPRPDRGNIGGRTSARLTLPVLA